MGTGRRRDDPRTVTARKVFFRVACALIQSYPHRVLEDSRAQEPITAKNLHGGGPSKSYWIMTTGGLLKVTVYDDWVHTKFEWPKEAIAAECWAFNNMLPNFDANPYSGKWNFHWSSGEPIDFISSVVMYALEKVVLKGEEAEAALEAAIARKAEETAAWYRQNGLDVPEAEEASTG